MHYRVGAFGITENLHLLKTVSILHDNPVLQPKILRARGLATRQPKPVRLHRYDDHYLYHNYSAKGSRRYELGEQHFYTEAHDNSTAIVELRLKS